MTDPLVTALDVARTSGEAQRVSIQRCDRHHSYMVQTYLLRGQTATMLNRVSKAQVPRRAFLGEVPTNEPIGCPDGCWINEHDR